MALVIYNLNRSFEMGNQSYFYRYLCNIVSEYEKNGNITSGELYYDFVQSCFDKLGLSMESSKRKRKRLMR